MQLMLVAGARPNYMKIAPLCWAIRERAPEAFTVDIVHTGQHYDEAMSESFFRDLDLPKPVVDLGVGSASHAVQTGRIMMAFERVVLEQRPDMVIVVGDVNSTVACALVAAKIDYGGSGRFGRPLLVHIEAGLRSRDRNMPEEINRMVTDSLSDVLFTTCRDAGDNLQNEGIDPSRIHFVGNPMIDSLRRCLPIARECELVRELRLAGRPFGLCTLHRPSNVDAREVLADLLGTLAEVAREGPILLPLHPRTRQRIEEFTLNGCFARLGHDGAQMPRRGLLGLEPLSYLEMLQALAAAEFVLTDSGGIQEESTALRLPCVTLRENTERPVTITQGTNVVAGIERRRIVQALAEARRKATTGRVPELWDGHAGERILSSLEEVGDGVR